MTATTLTETLWHVTDELDRAIVEDPLALCLPQKTAGQGQREPFARPSLELPESTGGHP